MTFEVASSPMSSRASSDIDMALVGRALLQKWPWLLVSTLTAGSLAYTWSRSQPPVYRADAVVLATTASSNSSGIIDQTLITAPPLPEGAADQALRSPAVVSAILDKLKTASGLTDEERGALFATLNDEMTRNSITSLRVIPQLNPFGNGLYIIQGEAPTASSARVLTDTAASSLIEWDANRASEGIQRSENTIRAQLADIEQQIRTSADGSVERRTLLQTRASLQENLARVSILLKAATGTLNRVSPAAQPFRPVAPRPLQTGILGGLLALILVTLVVTLRTLLDRTVKSEDDLLPFNSPTLGTIPRLRRRDMVLRGVLDQGPATGLYEAVGFLRVNLFAQLPHKERLRLTISSTAPGEGKSSVTASLADALAQAGKSVLIIDGDLRRGTQIDIWKQHREHSEWKQLTGSNGARSLREALQDPLNVQVLPVGTNVDLLPAGPGLHDSLAQLTQIDLGTILDQWSRPYDVVLLDSPPILALADGLVLAKHTDGILLVTEARVTTNQAIRAALRRIQRSGLHLIGFVLNKADLQRDDNYSYSYSPNRSTS